MTATTATSAAVAPSTTGGPASSGAGPTTGSAAASAASVPILTTATTAPASTTTAACGQVGDTSEKAARYSRTTGARLSGMVGEKVALGEHDCYERFVVEFSGAGDFPGWQVLYEPGPVIDSPAGQPVDVKGSAFLHVTFGTWMYPEPLHAGPRQVSSSGLQAVLEADLTQNFESVTTWVLGMDQPRPFTVFELDNPPRLVVDVYDAR
jgi:hypothetical protein